jgi:predicted Zn-dependent protease with MMP-like domain
MSPTRRRDRRGRGVRGRLIPPAAALAGTTIELPAWRSRGEVFDDLVLDAVQEVSRRWADELRDLEVVVQEVPPPLPDEAHGLVADGTAGGAVPLARALPAAGSRKPRLVVYRRPIELRAADLADLRDLLHEVAVDAVAELLGIEPDDVDPGQG